MVIVRRKSDGLFYNGARSNHRDGALVDDPNQCLPYKNKRGAFGALGRVCYIRVPVAGSRYSRYVYQPELWDQHYDVVPVTISITKGESA